MNCRICDREIPWVGECCLCGSVLMYAQRDRTTPFRERLHKIMIHLSKGVDD